MIEHYRKKPVVIQAVLWDGTPQRVAEIQAWVGHQGDNPNAPHRFVVGADGRASVWNDQERSWINVPVGHRIVRGPLGEFCPIAPEALALTYDRVEVAVGA